MYLYFYSSSISKVEINEVKKFWLLFWLNLMFSKIKVSNSLICLSCFSTCSVCSWICPLRLVTHWYVNCAVTFVDGSLLSITTCPSLYECGKLWISICLITGVTSSYWTVIGFFDNHSLKPLTSCDKSSVFSINTTTLLKLV